MEKVTFTHLDKTYTMTKDAIEAAYEYQKHQYLLSDAEDHLRALCFGWENKDGYIPGEVPDDKQRECLSDFEIDYGIPFGEAMRHLEAYVVKFQLSYSQELSEDEQWDYAIYQTIKELKEKEN